MNAGPSLGSLAVQAVRKFAHWRCLAHAGREWTFAELDETVEVLSTSPYGLRNRGGGRGVAAICGGFGQGDALMVEVA